METHNENTANTATLPQGWYDGRAKSWRWTQAKTGTWQLEITFDVSERGTPRGNCIGWFAITDKTIDKRVEQFMAMGYEPKSGDIGAEIGCDEQGMWGDLNRHDVRLFIEHDERGRARVNNVSKPNGGARASSVDQGALRAFGAQMRGAVMAAVQRAKADAAAGGPPRPTQPAPQRPAGPPRGFAPPAADADDVPF